MFHLHRSSDNQFYFTLRARNGRVLMTSETYSSKAMAEKGMKSVKATMHGKENAMFIPTYKDHTKQVATSQGNPEPPSLNLTTERMVNGKLKPVRVTAGKKKGK
jgi:uncharacterized protein YegP (UPF0339 family)